MSRLPGYHAKPSPFPPRTGIQAEIDATIERLVALRSWDACTRALCDDEPAELRALADLAKSAARACDTLFQRIAFNAGLSSMSGASPFVGLVSAGIEDDLLGGINARIERIEEDRAPREDENEQHSTLNHRQLGLRG